jgi:hypothetical protein
MQSNFEFLGVSEDSPSPHFRSVSVILTLLQSGVATCGVLPSLQHFGVRGVLQHVVRSLVCSTLG